MGTATMPAPRRRRVSAVTRVLSVDEVLAAVRLHGRHPGEPLACWERRFVRSALAAANPERLAA
jgi:hypothetical protein